MVFPPVRVHEFVLVEFFEYALVAPVRVASYPVRLGYCARLQVRKEEFEQVASEIILQVWADVFGLLED